MAAHPIPRRTSGLRARQRGAALLLIALIVLLAGLGFLFSQSPTSIQTERSNITGDALAQAKAALIGYAVTYRDTHASESYGYLPCPDTNNDGIADEPCGGTDVSVVGRLPWKTLGLAPLRDGSNECLWYAVSGRAKNNPKTAAYNWDTVGQFIIQDPAGNTLAGASPHEQTLAVLFSAGAPLNGQGRASAGASECGGSNTPADYLEGLGALGTGNTTVIVANADTVRNGSNNDKALWITPREIFDPIKRRSDFRSDISTMLNDIAVYLNSLAPASLPATATSNKGLGTTATAGTLAQLYAATNPSAAKLALFTNWFDNLLYTKPGSAFSVGADSGCYAALLFGGERSLTALPLQQRSNATERDTATNYVEGQPYPAAGAYVGNVDYDPNASSADLVRCIKGLTPPAVQAAFSTDFASFATAGASGAATANPDKTLALADASGSTGGCFWYANAVPLAGRTFRSYYTFQFAYSDDPAVLPDLRYGFTLQLVRSDQGSPANYCGSEYNSGALGPTATTSAPGTWGGRSYIVETDIYQSVTRNDPAGNHTAIMKNGSLDHAGFGSLTSSACNGTANLCEHTPVNTFEELPTPLAHNQRMEITTGCNASCGSCTPALHALPNTYAKVSVWVDCTGCSDVTSNLDRSAQRPTVEICTDLDSSMNSVYLGFTGGFSSSYPNPVSIRDFVFRSE